MKINKKKNYKLLDCTLRDGGYYNNWDYDKNVYESYISAINKSNIKYVEVGFRFDSEDKFLGPFAITSDNFIKKLKFKDTVNLALMINCNDLIKKNISPKKKVESMLNPKKNSPIDIIRLAAHFHEVPKVIKHIKIIKKKGYRVFLNLMQASNKSEYDFKKVINIIKKTNSVDVLYFADSLGAMKPQDIKRVCGFFNLYWQNEFGLHAHNNCNRALKNSIEAMKSGATWIDSTILGMGRGAGNTRTEDIIKSSKYFRKKFNLNSVQNVSDKFFGNLKKKYLWGSSKTYAFAATNNIHPTYVQVLQNEFQNNNNKILKILNKIKNANLISYNPLTLQKYFEENLKEKGTWNAKNWCKGRKILILGKGPLIKKYKDDLITFIKKNKPIVLSLNFNQIINKKLIDYYIISNQEKIILDFKKYYNTKKKVIMPKSRFYKIYTNKSYKKNFLNFGLKITSKKIEINKYYCAIPSNLVLFYALSLVKIGEADKIFLSGFDGYGSDDPREIEINKNFKSFSKILKNKLLSITPTSYDIKKTSLYVYI